jgi:hypothetical protein
MPTQKIESLISINGSITKFIKIPQVDSHGQPQVLGFTKEAALMPP